MHVYIDQKTLRTTHINKNREENVYLPAFLFYVDDIVIFGKEIKEIQSYLDILQFWCNEYNMIPGINKCQSVAPPDIKLNLYIGEGIYIPMFTLPMTATGINF